MDNRSYLFTRVKVVLDQQIISLMNS